MNEQQLDWTTATFPDIARDIVKLMNGREDDEDYLKTLAEKALAIVREREPENKQGDVVNRINRIVRDTYPRLETEAPNYWHDPNGKENLPNWRHNIFKYLTTGRGIKPIPEIEVLPSSKPTQIEDFALTETKPLLNNMTIQQLNLDTETQATLEAALNHSGMPLEDFIKQAIKVYAKTITGRNKAASEDLSDVSTHSLLTNSRYSTHQGRAAELTRRTIQAIKIYNTELATEPNDRWMITASAIASLIGSRQATIKEIMPQYQTSIDENNLNPEWNLTPYSNRKPGRKIEDVVHISKLVPDGLG
jgi:hypothetical protein